MHLFVQGWRNLGVRLTDRWFSFQRLLVAGVALVAGLAAPLARAQFNYSVPYFFQPFAGTAGTSGAVDGLGNLARFHNPGLMAVDASGNVYVADGTENTIRKITPAGLVTTIAGQAGTVGSTDGTGSAARFHAPSGVAVDGSGNLFVADFANNTIRKITPGGVVTTFAGTAGSNTGFADGTGTAARFNNPYGIAVDSSGNVFVTEFGNHTVRKITAAGVVTTLAGGVQSPGSTDGTGTVARFTAPNGIAVDSSGNLYVADSGNFTIRKITPAGVVTTVAGTVGVQGLNDGTGTAARFGSPQGVAVDAAGNVFVTDYLAGTIRRITSTGVVSTLAGFAGVLGALNGTGIDARFTNPVGVAVDAIGNLYVSDPGTFLIRVGVNPQAQSNYATPYFFTTFAGTANVEGYKDGTGPAAQFAFPQRPAVDSSGTVYVPDSGAHTIRRISPSGVVVTIAGLGGTSGTADGAGVSARFNRPEGVAVDGSGNVYVADTFNNAIRKITSAGAVTTIAGLAGAAGARADGTGSAARFNSPFAVAVDAAGNVYVADAANHQIRKITPAGLVTTLAGSGSLGSADGTGGSAQFNSPQGIAIDGSGNLFVADTNNRIIRKVTPAGVVTTLAGTAGLAGGLDGTGTAARFRGPVSVAVDASGNVFVAEMTPNNTIRKITPGGVVTTVAGQTGSAGAIDGSGSVVRFDDPQGVAVDADGNLYVADSANATLRVSVVPPSFKTQPANQIVSAGATATFTATVSSNVPINYEWRRNGVAIAGATTATLNIPNVQSANLGTYTLVATNVSGSTTSAAAVLSFTASPSFTTQPASQNVALGGNVTFSVVVGGTPPITYQWLKDGVTIGGATSSTLPLINVQSANLGNYTVIASNSAGTVVSNPATLALDISNAGRLVNLSVRSTAGTGAQTLIVGFAIGGAGTSGTKPLLIRGAGPTLNIFGVAGFLADPALSVFSGNTVVAANDNWNGDAQVTAVGGQVGAFAFSSAASKDAALFSSALGSGSYTVQITGIGNATGIALAEIYDGTSATAFTGTTPRLVNISARTVVGTGADILIAGFVVGGSTPKTLLVRAVGPTLSVFGVGNLLSDPKLDLYSGSTLIQSNDNWGGVAAIANAATSVGAFALDASSKDAALLVTLQPGTYSAQVSGVGNTTGVALVEIYEVP